MNKPAVSLNGSAAMLLPLLLLTACAAPLQPSTSVICPAPLAMPALPPSLKVPPPPASFLESAQSDIKAWQQRLTSSATR